MFKDFWSNLVTFETKSCPLPQANVTVDAVRCVQFLNVYGVNDLCIPYCLWRNRNRTTTDQNCNRRMDWNGHGGKFMEGKTPRRNRSEKTTANSCFWRTIWSWKKKFFREAEVVWCFNNTNGGCTSDVFDEMGFCLYCTLKVWVELHSI